MSTEYKEEYVRLSRFISMILRHNPGAIGIRIERVGAWANVDELIDGINAKSKYHIDRPLLERIVAADRKFMGSIMAKGLLPGNRQYVHLSPDYETAVTVGYRHSKPDPPVVLKIHAGQMAADGYDFMISDNGVWQIKEVPPQYLELFQPEE